MPDADGKGAKSAWAQRVLGFSPGTGGGPHGDLGGAQAQWAEGRAAVLAQLGQLEAAIRAMQDPMSEPAIILVKAIAANLTSAPDSRQKVAELRRYLETDSIIDDAELENGFGIAVHIRAPLMPALDALDQALAA